VRPSSASTVFWTFFLTVLRAVTVFIAGRTRHIDASVGSRQRQTAEG
jgi:hypothetical protein